MATHQFTFKAPLHLATSIDTLRPTIRHIYFDGEYMVATNGHVLVAISMIDLGFEPETIAELNDHYITPSDYNLLLSRQRKFKPLEVVKVGEHVYIKDTSTEIMVRLRKGEEIGKYPDWRTMINNQDNEPEPADVLQVGLNVEFLHIISKVLRPYLNVVNQLILTQYKRNRTIFISAQSDEIENTIALIMPIIIGDSFKHRLPTE